MRKFLVVNMNYLGDALLTTPALAALRTAHPASVIDVVVGQGAAADVLTGNPDINEIVPRTASGSWGRCVQLFQLLRSRRYSDVVILPPLPAYALTAFLARTPVRVGLRDRGMNRFLTRLQSTSAVHMADALLDTMPVREDARPKTRRLKVTVDTASRDSVRKLLREFGIDPDKQFLAVNVGATRIQKRWFAESFADVMDRLADIPSVIIGAGEIDTQMAADIVGKAGTAKTVNLVGKTTVKELAALLEAACVLISADSGPMHLATAVGTPTVALFGSTNPDITGPYDSESKALYHALPCAPCGNHPTCDGRYDCMRAITGLEVANAVREILGHQTARHLVELPVASNDSRRDAHAAEPSKRRKMRSGASRLNVRNVLVVTKFRFIGDTLLAIPIFRACRKIWPDAHITLLTGKNAKRLLQHNPYLNEIIEFDPNKADKGARADFRLVRQLLGTHYDVALVLNRSFHSALLPWLSRVRKRAGFDCEGRGFLLTKRVKYDRHKSEILCYFDTLRAIVADAPVETHLELWLTPEERAEAEGMIQKETGSLPDRRMLIGIQPGASLPGKRWDPQRFARIADLLVQDSPDVRILLIGGPDEVEASEEMIAACAEATRARMTSFVGKCSLRQTLGLLGRLGFFLGNDTAITHSAVALGASTVALFGPTSAMKWGNYSERNRVVESPSGSMDDIDVETVIQVVREVRSLDIPSAE